MAGGRLVQAADQVLSAGNPIQPRFKTNVNIKESRNFQVRKSVGDFLSLGGLVHRRMTQISVANAARPRPFRVSMGRATSAE